LDIKEHDMKKTPISALVLAFVFLLGNADLTSAAEPESQKSEAKQEQKKEIKKKSIKKKKEQHEEKKEEKKDEKKGS